MIYIQRRGDGHRETVDEFATRREARAMIAEYRLSDRSAEYYLSTRPCHAWREATADWPAAAAPPPECDDCGAPAVPGLAGDSGPANLCSRCYGERGAWSRDREGS
jgi:hypothetical protein